MVFQLRADAERGSPLPRHRPPFPLAFFFGAVESVEAVDAQTVAFTLNEPFAPFLSNLAYPTGLLVSPTAVMESGADFGRNPFGTGPFRFAEWRSNEAVVVERNTDYWGDPAGLEAVVFRPITDAQHPHGGNAGRRDRHDGRGSAHSALGVPG